MAILVWQSHSLRRSNGALVTEMANVRYMQSALEQSRAESLATGDRLQAVLDAATEVAIIATDLDGRVTVFNRGAEELLGYAASDVIGKSPAIWHDASEISREGQRLCGADESPPAGFEVFSRLAQTAGLRPHLWTYITRDGVRLEVSLALSTVRASDGSSLGYLGVARDLTAQRRAESDLRQLTQDLEHRVSERTAELQTTLQTLGQAQEGLARSEKLAALGALVAGVAHELNTPVGNCLTTASTLQERTHAIAQSARQGSMRKSAFEAYLEDASQASDILLRGLTVTAELVQHFKQLAVDQTSELRRSFKLASVVEDVVSLFRASWKATPYALDIDIDVESELDSYPGALGQVLGNILQNTLVHGFEGRSEGRLRISARMATLEIIEMNLEDNGIGMSDEVRRRAFDPFFTTKLGQGGSGLGLNIVYNTVTGMLGGTIDLQSVEGHGTRFVLRIPLAAPMASTPSAPPG
jgi:PAS domain S-box-containing protein